MTAPSKKTGRNRNSAESKTEKSFSPALLLRTIFGGGLMGLANLVPGISGGTMLLAAGIFPRFIESVANLTRFHFKRENILFLTGVLFSAGIVIGLLAGFVGNLVVTKTWIMYSLFIGLTLGGAPLVWQMAKEKKNAFKIGTFFGLFAMIGLTFLQLSGTETGTEADGFSRLLLAGIFGAAAMVLPGISGGYLLLLLGVYVTILRGIEQIFTALRSLDFPSIFEPAFGIALPVGIGIIIGIAGVSNLAKFLLDRFPNAVLGILFGLLLGAVAGLWPFQQGIEPESGSILKGQTIIETDGELFYELTEKPVDPADYPRTIFQPGGFQIAASIGLIGFGFLLTTAIGRIGNGEPKSERKPN